MKKNSGDGLPEAGLIKERGKRIFGRVRSNLRKYICKAEDKEKKKPDSDMGILVTEKGGRRRGSGGAIDGDP